MKGFTRFFICTLLCLSVSISSSKAQTTTGLNNPTLFHIGDVSGNDDWKDESLAYSASDTYCEIGGRKFDANVLSDTITFRGFGFSIPQNATITGITMELQAHKKGGAGNCIDHIIQLTNFEGQLIGQNKAITSSNWVKDDQDIYVTYGSSNDLWNTSLTPADINSSGFGVAIQAMSIKKDTKVQIDHVRISVSYIEPTTPLLHNGPGGVGSNDGLSNLVTWHLPSSLTVSSPPLSQGQPINQWTDESVFDNHAQTVTNQEPKANINTLNGYDVAHFRSADTVFFRTPNSATLNPNKISVFAVGNYTPLTHDWGPFVLKTDTWDWDDGYGICGNDKTQELIGFVSHYADHDVKTILPFNQTSVLSIIYDSATIEMFVDNLSQGSTPHSSSIEPSSNYLYIGSHITDKGAIWDDNLDGDIAEIIIYNQDVNLAQRNIIHNYLAAKYGLDLDANDFHTQDAVGQGDFDFNVAGIGRAIDGTMHQTAQGTGIIQMNSNFSIGPAGECYLFWGEQQASTTYNFTPNTQYMEQSNGLWRVSHHNLVGPINLQVDSVDLNVQKQGCETLYLIVSNDSSFASPTRYAMTYTNGNYSVSSINLNDGDYFSFEYIDKIVIDDLGYYNGSGTNNAPDLTDACYKLLVKSSANGTFNISESALVREVEIETNGFLSIDSTSFLTVETNIINNGMIVLNEHASIVQKSVGVSQNSGTGSYYVVRTGNQAADSYNIWSSPISQALQISVFPNTNACDMWIFEGVSQSWIHDFAVGYSTTCAGNPVTFSITDVIAGGDGYMDPTRGYFIPGAPTSSRIYAGQINNGDYNRTIYSTNLGNQPQWNDDDWNLIGNPYPCALNADSFWMENAINNTRITDAMYFWDNGDTAVGYNQTADYASWNSSGGVASGNSEIEPSGFIGSGQGFWVVANQNTDVVFNNSMRAVSNDQFFKTLPVNPNHNAWFRLTTPSNYKNNILIGFNDHSTDSIDIRYDAHKMVGNGLLRFASLIGTDEFVIQSISPVWPNESKTIPLVVFSSETGLHTFKEYKRENLPTNFKIFIRDNVLGVVHDLSQSDYTITLDANVEYKTRFEFVFSNVMDVSGGNQGSKGSPGSVTDIDELELEPFQIIQADEQTYIVNNSNTNGTIQVYDITGKKAFSQKIKKQGSTKLKWNHLASGTYIITISNSFQFQYSKQVIKP